MSTRIPPDGEHRTVLVFVPSTNELQRFVLTGAFTELGLGHRLHYVLPDGDADTMLRTGAPFITRGNSTVVRVPPDRFKKWKEIFRAGCAHYARLSPSFAIRAKLEVDPDWRGLWSMPGEDRDRLDREFDAIVDRLLDGMRPLPAIVELFDRFQPAYCVVPTSFLDLFANEVGWACAVEGVSCVMLQSGWDNLSSKGLVHSRTAFLGCWGRQSFEHAVVIQRMRDTRVAPLGAPHYEWLQPAPDTAVRQARAQLGVRDDERLILFGGSFRQFDETATLRQLEDAIARGSLGRTRVVYRPHPWRLARKDEDSFFQYEWAHVVFDPDMRERYLRDRAEPGYLERHGPMFDMPYLVRLMSASDAIISPMSTLLLEALVLDKPTLAIAFGDGKHRYNPGVAAQMTHFADLRDSRALIWCDSAERLIDECRQLLEVDPQACAAARGRLLGTLVVREPGTYAGRLAEFCREVVEPMAPTTHSSRVNASSARIP